MASRHSIECNCIDLTYEKYQELKHEVGVKYVMKRVARIIFEVHQSISKVLPSLTVQTLFAVAIRIHLPHFD